MDVRGGKDGYEVKRVEGEGGKVERWPRDAFEPLWPFRNYRGVARARPLFESMIFGPCATIFPPFKILTILDNPVHLATRREAAARPLDEQPFSATSAEWFYDFMLHFERFADLFDFPPKARWERTS